MLETTKLCSSHISRTLHQRSGRQPVFLLFLLSSTLYFSATYSHSSCAPQYQHFCARCLSSSSSINACEAILREGRARATAVLGVSYPFPKYNADLLSFAKTESPENASVAVCAGFLRMLLRDRACWGVRQDSILAARALAAEARRTLPLNGGTYIARGGTVLWIPPARKALLEQLRRKRKGCARRQAQGLFCAFTLASPAREPQVLQLPPPGLLGLMQEIASIAACRPSSVTTINIGEGIWETRTTC